MKPSDEKLKRLMVSGKSKKPNCGTLNYIAECRGTRKLPSLSRESQPRAVQQGRI